MSQHKDEVVRGIEPFIGEQLGLLKPVEELWQPQDLLPDLTGADWAEAVRKLREDAKALPNDLMVVLVGDMVTEEALPSYQTWLNRVPGLKDPDGVGQNPWGRWVRGWTAEENRHGDILSRYLYLSGRVNMRSVEVTINNLIRNGFDMESGEDPYKAFIYTSFQERATKISHGNVGKLAKKAGDGLLFKICNMISTDEARHEEAYKRFIAKIMEIDAQGVVLAFEEMMKKTISMPARLMDDGGGLDLFERFSVVAQRLGVYTARDYAEIIEHLVEYWNLPTKTGLSGMAARAQDYLCDLSARYHRLADVMERKLARKTPVTFPWIFNQTV